MATYQAIQQRVQAIVIDLPTAVTSYVPTLVNEAMRKLQREHDFRCAEAKTALMITATQTRVLAAGPSDWMKIRGLPIMISDQARVRELGYTEERAWVEREFGASEVGEADPDTLDGCPQVILRSEDTTPQGGFNFEVFPFSDGLSLWENGQYRIQVPYWKFLPALSAAGDINWLTENGADYIAYMAAADAFMLNWDEGRAAQWVGRAQLALADIRKADKRARMAAVGGNIRVSGDVNASRIGYGDGYGRSNR